MFYGANIFTIRADAFLPFLQDRTVESLPLLRRVKVEMNVEVSTSEDCPSRHQFSLQAFSGLPSIRAFAPQEFFLFVRFQENNYW